MNRSALFIAGVLLAAAFGVLQLVPGGFIPTQDKLYLMGGVKLPEGASLEPLVRTTVRVKFRRSSSPR